MHAHPRRRSGGADRFEQATSQEWQGSATTGHVRLRQPLRSVWPARSKVNITAFVPVTLKPLRVSPRIRLPTYRTYVRGVGFSAPTTRCRDIHKASLTTVLDPSRVRMRRLCGREDLTVVPPDPTEPPIATFVELDAPATWMLCQTKRSQISPDPTDQVSPYAGTRRQAVPKSGSPTATQNYDSQQCQRGHSHRQHHTPHGKARLCEVVRLIATVLSAEQVQVRKERRGRRDLRHLAIAERGDLFRLVTRPLSLAATT